MAARRQGRLFPHRLDDHALGPLAVKLGVEHLLPGTQIELAAGDGQEDLMPEQEVLQVRVSVVFAGAVVAVIRTLGGELLEPLADVFDEAALGVVDVDGGP